MTTSLTSKVTHTRAALKAVRALARRLDRAGAGYAGAVTHLVEAAAELSIYLDAQVDAAREYRRREGEPL